MGYAAAALEFFGDGLRGGQRLAYVGSEPVAEQRERLDPLGDVGTLIDKGALQLFELGDLYQVGEPIDAVAQVATYTAALDVALSDGYTGLRVAAQVTDLVAEPHTRDTHVRWESVADRFISILRFLPSAATAARLSRSRSFPISPPSTRRPIPPSSRFRSISMASPAISPLPARSTSSPPRTSTACSSSPASRATMSRSTSGGWLLDLQL